MTTGFVDTPLSASLLGHDLESRRDQLRTTLPIGRLVGPDDVAALAATSWSVKGDHGLNFERRR